MTDEFSRREVLMSATALTAAASVGSALSARAQSARAPGAPNLARVDAVLRAAVDAKEVPGIVAMATTDKGLLYEGTFGTRDLGKGPAMTRDTVFRIASMTKAVTSVAAMQLVEQGKLTLEGPLPDIDKALSAPQVLTGFDTSGAPQLGAGAAARETTQLLLALQLLRHLPGRRRRPIHDRPHRRRPCPLGLGLSAPGKRHRPQRRGGQGGVGYGGAADGPGDPQRQRAAGVGAELRRRAGKASSEALAHHRFALGPQRPGAVRIQRVALHAGEDARNVDDPGHAAILAVAAADVVSRRRHAGRAGTAPAR